MEVILQVVPLSQRSGVIEWCSNTVPLSTYLIGGGGVVGAHVRYRKGDWSPAVCRQKMFVSYAQFIWPHTGNHILCTLTEVVVITSYQLMPE